MRTPTLLLALVAAALLPLPAAAHFSWPGGPPCDGTLQACVDAVPAGEEIEVQGPGPIAETITIEKSLSLYGSASLPPHFAPGASVFAFPQGTGDHRVRIQGLILEGGSIAIGHITTGSLVAEVVDNSITVSGVEGIRLFTGTDGEGRGSLDFTIEGNQIVNPSDAFATQRHALLTDFAFPGAITGRIRGNQVTMGAIDQSAAMNLANGPANLDLEVSGNVVTGGGFDEAISVFQSSETGSIDAVVAGNLVVGSPGMQGRIRRGISFNGSGGLLELLAVNNTLAANEIGLFVSGRPDLGAGITGLVANNAIVDNSVFGFGVEPTLWASIANRNNLDSGNGVSGEGPTYEPGPGTITAPALLDAASLYRPLPGSPVRDAGDTGALPAVLTADIDGLPRVQGAAVDIGAYELPEPGAAASGAAVLLVLGALGGGRARRRAIGAGARESAKRWPALACTALVSLAALRRWNARSS